MYQGKLPAAGDMAVIVKPSFCGCYFNIGLVVKVTRVFGPLMSCCLQCRAISWGHAHMFADVEPVGGRYGPIELDRLRKLEDPDAGKVVESDIALPRKEEIVGWNVYAGGRKVAYVDGPAFPKIAVRGEW